MSDTDSDTDPEPTGTIEAVELYWRPGCPFCSMLERDLVEAGVPFVKRNIWEDPAAADVVRSAADGNETVPTVVIGGRALVNPPASAVTAVLAAVAPHLLAS